MFWVDVISMNYIISDAFLTRRSLRGRLCVRAHATAAAVGGQDGTSPRHLPVGGLQPLPHLYRRKGIAIQV